MTPDTRASFLAQMEAEGIDPNGVEAQAFLARQEAPKPRRMTMTPIEPRQAGSLKGFGFSLHWHDAEENA